MRWQVICLAMLLGLMACSPIKTYDQNQGRKLGQQQLLRIQKWAINGRLLIKSDDVLTANIQWRHDQHSDQLKLYGALGIGAILIKIDDDEIILDTGAGEPQHARDIDAFIARQVGFIVPITALRHWVLGAYLDNVPVLQLENGFLQSGWRVTFQEYMQTSVGMMPHRIKITKQHILLKLVIDQWEIQ